MDRNSGNPSLAKPPRGASAAPHWWTLPADDVLRRLSTDANAGLSAAEVTKRREKHGFNQLPEEPPVPLWKKILSQFQELIIWILLAAAVISGLIGDWIDTAAILAIVLLNAAISLFQEEHASRALTALQKLSSPIVKVVRQGVLETVPSRALVPGDRIELEAGDHVPADARLLRAFGLCTQEAALTGESIPVDKQADVVLSDGAPLGDRRNMVFMGTVASAGKASAVVVATGMATELGQIAGLLQRFKPEPTPLQRRLAELGKILIVVCLAIVTIIFGLHVLRGGGFFDVLLISISLAVAAVPEGMPAVVTVTLAIGLNRMVKRNALVRRLPSVETLGCVTVICSDKTGTLTRNEMTVREIVAGKAHYRLTGVGYAPHGEYLKRLRPTTEDVSLTRPSTTTAKPEVTGEEPVDPKTEYDLILALTIAARCNHASLIPAANGGAWQVIGDPTEGALLVAARKAGIEFTRESVLDEIP
ncbi:MAG TPA: HAD-IC family P-type ATPase, partial [Lacipirellulaceae bacterium]|nr:HAD-IC family P-type ATPase [Lacipirellulaceae bacterium]